MSLLIHLRDPMTTTVTFCVRFSGTNVINSDNLQLLLLLLFLFFVKGDFHESICHIRRLTRPGL